VGALVEGPGFYPHLSGRRNLTLFDAAGKNGVRATRTRRVDDVLERVGLADVGRRPVRAYSMGMRQRLGLAAALLRHPRLLILDEPTNGLDPQGIHELRTLFVDLVSEGTTVFLSSHLLSEVELICTRAAMMANGRLVAQDRVEALLAPTGVLRIESPDASVAADVLRARRLPVEWLDQTHLRVHLNGEPAESVNSLLVSQGVRIRELARERPTLEDVFLGLTGTSAAPEEQP
jgi:ABC-2 type transport system ATP-binding protein